MIVNVYREDAPFQISNLPFLRLHDYAICVRSIYAEFYDDVPSGYVTLSSSLVAGNNLNPKQEILSFFSDSFFPKIIHYTPANLTWYPLQSGYIDENTIDFIIENSTVKKFKKLHLQLEFDELE